jgi:hypothetical protein
MVTPPLLCRLHFLIVNNRVLPVANDLNIPEIRSQLLPVGKSQAVALTWRDLHSADHPFWQQLYAHYERQYPGLDRQGQGCFAIGLLARELGRVVAEASMQNCPLPVLEPANLGIGISADASLSLCYQSKALECIVRGHDFHRQRTAWLVALFAPLVEAQRQSCRLGAAAQWRLISDALAYAWLQVGKQQKAEDFARRDFFEGLLGEASKLNNRQVRWTSLHWQDRIETFVSRGGCCRYYTADDGDYCRTCVHRDTEQQRTLMTQWYEAASLSD